MIIVGGTGFYLKALIDGLSLGLKKIKLDILKMLIIRFFWIKSICKNWTKNDRYRIEKVYSIYKQSD